MKARSLHIVILGLFAGTAFATDLSKLLPEQKELTDGTKLETFGLSNHPEWMRSNPQVFKTATELEPVVKSFRTPSLHAEDLDQVLWAYYRLVNDLHVVLFEFKDAKKTKPTETALLESISKVKACKTFSNETTLALIFGSDLQASTQLVDAVARRFNVKQPQK
jgi:hypothetical protein